MLKTNFELNRNHYNLEMHFWGISTIDLSF